MKRVLVTGGNGQLAQNIKKHKPKLKDVFVFDFVPSAELDITDNSEVRNILTKNHYDYCINCAAYTQVDQAESEPELSERINGEGAKNLAETCAETNCTLIHISTDFVFDGNQSTPYTENDPASPASAYGRSKLMGERDIAGAMTHYFILRTSWLYSEYGKNFMKSMLKYGRERESLRVVFDQIGSPTYAGDLAAAILKIMESGSTAYGIYHYSNEGVASWYDFARAIFDEVTIEAKLLPIRTAQYPLPAKRPAFSVLDKTKIKEVFDLEIPHWRESLKKALSINAGTENN